MELKFETLPQEKKLKIINAALNVFAADGYANASTNRIVEAAEISKGALFHYFKNKKKLYLYLYDYCLEFIAINFYKQLDLTIDDFFDFMAHSGAVKMAINDTHPQIFQFVQAAYYEPQPEFESEIYHKSHQIIAEHTATMFAHIDYSKFREDLDIQMAVKSIIFCFEGFLNQLVQESKIKKEPLDYNTIPPLIEPYYQFLKQVYYKPEYAQPHKEAL